MPGNRPTVSAGKWVWSLSGDITPTVNMAAGTVLIPPGCEQTKLSRHEGKEEIYYVVAGTGVFVLEDEHHEVEAGCTVYIGPGVGHRAVNTGADDLRLFWVNSPPVFETPEEYRDYTKDWKQVR